MGKAPAGFRRDGPTEKAGHQCAGSEILVTSSYFYALFSVGYTNNKKMIETLNYPRIRLINNQYSFQFAFLVQKWMMIISNSFPVASNHPFCPKIESCSCQYMLIHMAIWRGFGDGDLGMFTQKCGDLNSQKVVMFDRQKWGLAGALALNIVRWGVGT